MNDITKIFKMKSSPEWRFIAGIALFIPVTVIGGFVVSLLIRQIF